jgi:hypothetical protein
LQRAASPSDPTFPCDDIIALPDFRPRSESNRRSIQASFNSPAGTGRALISPRKNSSVNVHLLGLRATSENSLILG